MRVSLVTGERREMIAKEVYVFTRAVPGAPVRPRKNISCTLKYFDRMCDQNGRTLEPCMLTGQFLLWNEKCCMLTVACNEEVEKYFGSSDSVLHVGLAKTSDMTWAELGQWAVGGGDACDWTPDPHGIVGQYFSPATGLRRREWGGAFET